MADFEQLNIVLVALVAIVALVGLVALTFGGGSGLSVPSQTSSRASGDSLTGMATNLVGAPTETATKKATDPECANGKLWDPESGCPQPTTFSLSVDNVKKYPAVVVNEYNKRKTQQETKNPDAKHLVGDKNFGTGASPPKDVSGDSLSRDFCKSDSECEPGYYCKTIIRDSKGVYGETIVGVKECAPKSKSAPVATNPCKDAFSQVSPGAVGCTTFDDCKGVKTKYGKETISCWQPPQPDPKYQQVLADGTMCYTCV